ATVRSRGVYTGVALDCHRATAGARALRLRGQRDPPGAGAAGVREWTADSRPDATCLSPNQPVALSRAGVRANRTVCRRDRRGPAAAGGSPTWHAPAGAPDERSAGE